MAIGYENAFAEYSRVYHFAKYALWAGSAAWVNCPSLMVDGVATLFRRHLLNSGDAGLDEGQRVILRAAYDRLISRDPEYAWTTGQWMTERQGGSDVSMTETLATFDPEGGVGLGVKAADGNELGPWRLDGFKWFSSATDADMVVMLARTPKGISTFFAPMRRMLKQKDVLGNDTELNGIQIQRLKSKLGTRALPTAELVLNGVRGWLVGEDGRGTKEIATVLNVARIHNGVTAIGLWGRGLSVVRAFTRVRVVGRRPLWERTAYMQTVARMHAEYKANVLFNMFVASLLGVDEQEDASAINGQNFEPGAQGLGQVPGLQSVVMAKHLLRVLTPALKGHCSKTAISGLQECMECMGGVGYLENDDMQYNIARLYRDANVMPIWEGTTDMMADDAVLRVLFGKVKEEIAGALGEWINVVLGQVQRSGKFSNQADTVQGWWSELKKFVTSASKEEAEFKCRAAMDILVDIVQGLLLIVDALRDGDEVACLVVETWFTGKVVHASLKQTTWKEQVNANMKIVFGSEGPVVVSARL